MNIEDLKSKTISELTNIAKDLKIQGHSGLRKQDLIFRILEAKTEKDGLMFGQGVLDMVLDLSSSMFIWVMVCSFFEGD